MCSFQAALTPQTIATLISVLRSRTMPTRMVLIASLVFALAGCGDGSPAGGDGEQRHVVAAFYPLAFAAERIAGNTAQVRNLTPPGAEPHDFELSGRDVRSVADAELVLYLGGGFQPALERAIESTDANALDLLDGLELREAPGDEDPEENGRDPHVWLDPTLFAQIALRTGAKLGRQAQARELADELEQLDAELREGLSGCERRKLVTSHAAFGYLAARYGLEQVPITGLSPETEPTPADLGDVVEQVRAHGATTIFFETLVSPRLAETVAREVGASTAVLNPLEGLTERQADAGEDYFSIMRANLVALREALSCR